MESGTKAAGLGKSDHPYTNFPLRFVKFSPLHRTDKTLSFIIINGDST